MNSFFAKTFFRNKVIKIRVYTKDRRVQEHYVIPDKNTVSIPGRSFTINPQDLFLEEGIPTFTFNADDPTPVPVFLNPLDWNASSVNTIDFHLAIEEKVSQNILNNLNAGDNKPNLALFITGVGMALISGGLYFIYTMLEEVLNNLDEINRIVGLGG